MLPLGLVLLPGTLLWRAGRWVVRTGGVSRLRHVGYAALALAVPYALVAGALALASRSALATPSLSQAVVCSFLLALIAGVARRCAGARAVVAADRPAPGPGALADPGHGRGAGGAHRRPGACSRSARSPCTWRSTAVYATLAPGTVGSGLLLLAQLAYVPNAVVWAISFTLGPGFAFGTEHGDRADRLRARPDARLPAARGAARPGCTRRFRPGCP